jgi:hypothetical protein
MGKRCLIIMALIMSFALVVTTIAEQENHVLGLYNVSFDLGIEDRVDWILSEPINSESLDGSLTFTQYSATIMADLTESEFYSERERLGRTPSIGSAIIRIEQYNSTKDVSVNGTKMLINSPIGISKRIIDGRNGTIGTVNDGRTYLAAWWMENNASAAISSSYPWNEGTLSLLKTIHIEKINPAAWWNGSIPADACIKGDDSSLSQPYIGPSYAWAGPGKGAIDGMEDQNYFNQETNQSNNVQQTSSNGPFVGSSESDKYHYPSCSAAKRIKSSNLVTFSSSTEARGAGYVPCSICSPP